MNKVFCKKIFLIVAGVILTKLSFANVGVFVFGGAGENPTISKTDKIQMVSEIVKIKPLPDYLNLETTDKYFFWARYECKFILKNLSNETVNAQVAFPISGMEKNPSLAQILKSKNFKAFSKSLSSKHVKNYEVQHFENDKEGKFQSLSAWDMEFQPNEILELEVSYELAGETGVTSLEKRSSSDFELYELLDVELFYLKMLQFVIMKNFPYVTKTGSSWAGKIENAKFIFDVDEFEKRLNENADSEKNELSFTKNGHWMRRVNPDCTENNGIMTVEMSPFEPQDDFSISYIFTMIPKNEKTFDLLLEYIEENYEKIWNQQHPYEDENAKSSRKLIFSNKEKKNIADVLLEFYGIKTDNPKILKFLERQFWYPVKTAPKIEESFKKKLLKLSKQ